MQVKSIAEWSKGILAILSTFIKLPFAIKTFVFFLFLSDSLIQVLLYYMFWMQNISMRRFFYAPKSMKNYLECKESI